ncbi:MAG: TMEM43 family protein, partial [Planctomycetota bacterium]
MSNVFTETTHQSWFSRIGNSIKGILIGGIVILVSFPLLFWNEGRAVKTARSLDEGEGATRSVASERVDPVNDGQLVHVTGTAITSELLSDAEFGIEVNAIRLRRITEMYQWTEDVETRKKKKLGGGTTTEKTYTYETVWSDDAIDSKRFHHSEGHENPGRMLFPAKVISAKAVTVGAFQLPESMVGQISGSESVVLNESNIPESMSDRMTLVGSDTLFVGQEIQNPQVGDTRVRFVMTPSNQISLIAQQAGETFKPYQTHAGRALSMLEMGTHDAAEMFQHARQANTALT